MEPLTVWQVFCNLALPNGTSTVLAILVKLPDFYALDPAFRFWHAEAQFGQCRISSSWPARNTRLWRTSCYAPSLSEKMLTASDLGDCKPSVLVNHLLSALREFCLEIILQQLFLKCIPTNVQDVLAGSDLTDIKCLGDQIMSFLCCQALLVCNVFSFDDAPKVDDDSANPACVQCLLSQLHLLDAQPHPNILHCVCCYHKCFGQTAHQCKPPSLWGRETPTRTLNSNECI